MLYPSVKIEYLKNTSKDPK